MVSRITSCGRLVSHSRTSRTFSGIHRTATIQTSTSRCSSTLGNHRNEILATPTVSAFWMCSVRPNSLPSEPTAAVLAPVAPVYTPIAVLANVSGAVSVEVTIASDGTVRSTNALNGNKLLIHASLEAAKRWHFEPGAPDRNAILKFSFRIMPKGTAEEDLGAMFAPLFSIEVRNTIPDQTVNYDPAANVKKADKW